MKLLRVGSIRASRAKPSLLCSTLSSSTVTLAAKAHIVKVAARSLGFDLVGITDTSPAAKAGHYKQWLQRGYAGTMAYLQRNVELRADPALILEGARSVICVAMNYRRSDGFLGSAATGNVCHGYASRAVGEPAVTPTDQDEPFGVVAQYARGADYHQVLRERLEQLAGVLAARIDEPFRYRVCVDTAPVLERELAARAGLGWIGRNTCLLHPDLGSYLFLGELFTTLALPPDAPLTDRCATCTRCVDACPTSALEPRLLDARRCIAYLTIEHRGEIPNELQSAIGDRVFGCDICQQVCPYNARAPLTPHEPFQHDVLGASVPLAEWEHISSRQHRRRTRGSAAGRASASMWRRNARLALENRRQLSPAPGPGLDK